MTPRLGKEKIVHWEGHNYRVDMLDNLKDVLAFTNGRPVVEEGDVFSYHAFNFNDTVSCERAAFENGDMLLVTVRDEGDYSENTPGQPAYVVMYACTRLA